MLSLELTLDQLDRVDTWSRRNSRSISVWAVLLGQEDHYVITVNCTDLEAVWLSLLI
jgi:hypothetical protein